MDIILYYIRDNLVSVHYFLYAFVCLFLMFAIIGYLFKQKYAKLTINVGSSQPKKELNQNSVNQVKTNAPQVIKNNQVNINQTNTNSQTNYVKQVNTVNQGYVNNQAGTLNAKTIPNLNSQIKPTVIPNNNGQINSLNMNNQIK